MQFQMTIKTDTRAIWHSARRASGPTAESVAAYRKGIASKISSRHLVVADVAKIVAGDVRQWAEVTRLPAKLRERAEGMARAAVQMRRAAMAQPVALDLRGRWMVHMQGKLLAEAERRGLPVMVDCARAENQPVRLVEIHRTEHGDWVGLLRGEGWADYGSRVRARRKTVVLLAGTDDAGWWAVRVPATVDSVAGGLRWLEPAAVRRARADGMRVLRQGDVWIVERARGDAMGTTRLPLGHRWDAGSRMLHHGAHSEVHVPWPAVPVPQNTLAADGVGRRSAD